MIIQLGFYRRRPGLSVEEFRHLWSNIYGPLYAEHPELRRHLRRYVQHRLSPRNPQSDDAIPYDGFSEAWFESEQDVAALLGEPIYLERIAPMASSFLDVENSKLVAYDAPVYQIGAAPELEL